MRFAVFAAFLFLSALSAPSSGQSPATANSLSVEDVVGMVKNGLSEELIITRIRKSGKGFDLSPDELLELKKLKVSDNIVRYLLDPSLPYAPVPPPSPPSGPLATPKPTAPAKVYPSDKFAAQVPSEPGVYYFGDAEQAVKLESKVLLGFKQAPGLTKFVGKKARKLAYLPGAAARLRITENNPILYVRLSDGKSIEEEVLVALERKSDRRELDLGPGEKQELDLNSIRQFDSVEVGPGLFRITPAPLKDSEYLLFQIGSAQKDKGIEGKGAEFAIEKTAKKK